MTPWLDTHAHLDDPDEPLDAVHGALGRLVDAGWPGGLTAGYGPERLERSRLLVQQWPMLRRAVGMHPQYLAACLDDATRQRAEAAMHAELEDDQEVLALGEIGVDRRFKDAWPLDAQMAYFRAGLHAARHHGKPVVLHIVGWYGHALTALREVGVPNGGAVHRWSGPLELLPSFTSLGLGIAMALEPRGEPHKWQALARAIPTDHLLLETDWPFLALGYDHAVVRMSALGEQIAAWRGITAAGLQQQVAANARLRYHLAP